MKTDEDVHKAVRRFLQNPDTMLLEIARMPHEELVIFTMQLLGMKNMEQQLIERLVSPPPALASEDFVGDFDYGDGDAGGRHSSAEDSLLGLIAPEGVCDVSGCAPLGPPHLWQNISPRKSLWNSEDDEESYERDPVRWKLNVLQWQAQVDKEEEDDDRQRRDSEGPTGNVPILAADAWGEY